MRDHHYFSPFIIFHQLNEVNVERRFDATQNSAPQNGFDYTKFFDFGFFSNTAASFAGAPHPASQNVNKENSYIFDYQKQIDPNTVLLHKTVLPRTQSKNAVPEVYWRLWCWVVREKNSILLVSRKLTIEKRFSRNTQHFFQIFYSFKFTYKIKHWELKNIVKF